MTPSPRFDFTAPVPAVADLGRVHFVAIGGAGMSAVARLMLARGVRVSGCDARDSDGLRALEALGASVAVGHDVTHVENADTVVVSSAIREDNPELAAARARGLRVLHRSAALAAVADGRRVVAVAGANGKTTTTSMLAVALDAAGSEPSYASGGEIAQLGGNAAWGAGPDVVVEADESDGSFLVYRPEVAVVTNVQPDHLDFYGTVEAVQAAYAAFADSIRPGGLLVACADDEGSAALAQRHRDRGRRVLTYGFDPGADLRVLSSTADGFGSHSRLALVLPTDDGAEASSMTLDLSLRVPGAHNVLNALAALLVATAGLRLPAQPVLDGLAAFDGARRRFEVHGLADGVRVVDDYAHNAPKVAAVVRTAREVLDRAGRGRLIVLFQPHLYSRTRDFAEGFASGLASADHVLLLDIYGAREDPIPGVTTELIAGPLRDLPGERVVETGLSFDAATARTLELAEDGDLVLTVGAGDVTTLAPRLLATLQKRSLSRVSEGSRP